MPYSSICLPAGSCLLHCLPGREVCLAACLPACLDTAVLPACLPATACQDFWNFCVLCCLPACWILGFRWVLHLGSACSSACLPACWVYLLPALPAWEDFWDGSRSGYRYQFCYLQMPFRYRSGITCLPAACISPPAAVLFLPACVSGCRFLECTVFCCRYLRFTVLPCVTVTDAAFL